jgi:hypothetical protein
VDVDTDGLGAGSYEAAIVIEAAEAEPRTIPVTLTVEESPPVLAVAPSSLSFSATQGGADPAAKTLTLSNDGGGTLDWSASENASWLSVSPSGGTLTVTAALAGLNAGTYTTDVSVSSNGGNTTIPVTFTVAPASTTPEGLIAAYGFEETTGGTSADGSGLGHTGQITGATRTSSGRYGRALTFDGINDWMTVNRTDALDLRTGITMSAWVNPTQVGSVYRTVMGKEMPGGLVYTLYAGDGTGKASGRVYTTSEFGATAAANTQLNTWTFLAATWDRTTLRLFVNGIEVASRPLTGTMRASGGPLRIGGNAIWSEWFAGRIDEVRLYNRALTLPEIQGDMGRAVPAAA